MKHGDAGASTPIVIRVVGPVQDRFWARVDRSGGEWSCWPWTGAAYTTGYGAMKVDGKKLASHRIAWELTNGPIPDGLYDEIIRLRAALERRESAREHAAQQQAAAIDRALTDVRQALEARAKQHRPWWRVWDRGTV